MKQWFFLDGIDASGDELAVNQGIELAVPVLTDPADAAAIRFDGAPVGAKPACHLSFFEGFVEKGFHG
jgi:hypothetical protein